MTTLADHVYYIGSARQASDYITITNFLINYIRNTYERGDDIAIALEEGEDKSFDNLRPRLQYSRSLDAETAQLENAEFQVQYKVEFSDYNRRKNLYEENQVKAAALLWRQCAPTMRAKLQARSNFDKIKSDPVRLLKAINEHALNFESTQYRMKTILDAMRGLINLRQKDDESPIDYIKRFKAAKDVFLSHIGQGFMFPAVMADNEAFGNAASMLEDTTNPDDMESAKAAMMEETKKEFDAFLAYVYMDNADSA